MSTCVFIQIRCKPGTTYKVAENIALREIHSELYSTSGDFDLLMKLYIPSDADVGKYINDQLLDIEGIERSLTTMTPSRLSASSTVGTAIPIASNSLATVTNGAVAVSIGPECTISTREVSRGGRIRTNVRDDASPASVCSVGRATAKRIDPRRRSCSGL